MKLKDFLNESGIIEKGKGKGMPKWEYEDARGVKHTGWQEKFTDRGGTDVTYFMRDAETDELSVVSGSRAKKMVRIWK